MKIKFIAFLSLFGSLANAQTNGSFVYDGINRSYIVYTPPTYVPGSSLPLVFVLHGFTQSAQNIMDVSGFNAIADTGNFIVVYPNGVGNAWNSNSGLSGGSTADDIGFISALTDTIFNRFGIDTTRVYSCGFSAGGYMSHRLACESPRCYAAIASVAGTMSSAAYSACNPTRAVPVMQIHGTADAVVSYNGGFGGVSVADVIAKWTTIDGCPAGPIVTALPNINLFDNSTVESNLYSPCSDNTEVELLKVIGGGHQWPGTASLLGGLGALNRDINASGEIWSFFRGKTCNSLSTSVFDTKQLGIDLIPVGSDRYLVSADTSGPLDFSIYDFSGKVISSGKTTDGGTIDMSVFSKGFYVIVLSTAQNHHTKRIFR